jgi:3-oxocholest-4-en-26-oyl-CoA dehydrogenase beta subunit
MDFSFSEEQEAVRELAGRIVTDLATHERLREIESDPDGEWFDRKLWAELAAAGLLGIGLPEDVGGAGLGFVETGLVVEAMGHGAAYIPAIETVAVAAPAIARFGSEGQGQSWLPGVVSGDTVVTTGLVELGGTPLSPSLTAEADGDGDGWILTGTRSCVPSGLIADAVLCPAQAGPDAVAVFIIDTTADGVSRQRQVTNTGQPEAVVTLDGVRIGPDALLGSVDDGPAIVEWLVQRSTASLALAQAGAAAAALALVAEYTKTREQFGKPIATFQAVGQRAADAYVDTEAIRLTAWQAAWRIGEGLPADKEVAIAKFWAADGGQRVVHAAVHLHGGVGVDRDYPLHRYFLMTKHIELTLGGATEQLLQLGAMLAAEPV